MKALTEQQKTILFQWGHADGVIAKNALCPAHKNWNEQNFDADYLAGYIAGYGKNINN